MTSWAPYCARVLIVTFLAASPFGSPAAIGQTTASPARQIVPVALDGSIRVRLPNDAGKAGTTLEAVLSPDGSRPLDPQPGRIGEDGMVTVVGGRPGYHTLM